MKDGDRATDALYLKNLLSNGFGAVSGFFSCSNKVIMNEMYVADSRTLQAYMINGKSNCEAV